MADDLRTRFTAELKTAMLAKDAARTSGLRMITAKLKDADIAARPSGVEKVPDDQIISMLRGMVKSRAESAAMYRQGNRPELAEKEEAEIAIIESFLPQQMDEAAMQEAVRDAVAESGAQNIKDMGKVMAVLRAKHAASLDMAKAGPLVKAALGG
ncbi:GatB/YqeY domain-containing protein [Roseomonas frigidaquae]|uniref:GatB/YqeY domain-containing protein n=1 Tax=Falsiroseomonas frigidaquae TaxID=487318 RepID=A0ABX1ESF8_9PROT|nr:GatB/YqeY domain-containing protein [Falsiroseomonas frigidaquae]NKE43455.1 GatB/YqeY domain-containing protein [Falsiroseomonas frigidaquae]